MQFTEVNTNSVPIQIIISIHRWSRLVSLFPLLSIFVVVFGIVACLVFLRSLFDRIRSACIVHSHTFPMYRRNSQIESGFTYLLSMLEMMSVFFFIFHEMNIFFFGLCFNRCRSANNTMPSTSSYTLSTRILLVKSTKNTLDKFLFFCFSALFSIKFIHQTRRASFLLQREKVKMSVSPIWCFCFSCFRCYLEQPRQNFTFDHMNDLKNY